MIRKKKNGVTQSETLAEMLLNKQAYDDFYASDGDEEIGFSIPNFSKKESEDSEMN